MTQKISGEEKENALGLKSGKEMDICLKCSTRKVISTTQPKVKEGVWENILSHMFCAQCLAGIGREDLPLMDVAAIIAGIEGSDVQKVAKRLHGIILRGKLESYIPDEYPVVRKDGKRGKVCMIPASEVMRVVTLATLKFINNSR